MKGFIVAVLQGESSVANKLAASCIGVQAFATAGAAVYDWHQAEQGVTVACGCKIFV